MGDCVTLSEGKRIAIAGVAFGVVSLILSTRFNIWITLGGAIATAVALLMLLREI